MKTVDWEGIDAEIRAAVARNPRITWFDLWAHTRHGCASVEGLKVSMQKFWRRTGRAHPAMAGRHGHGTFVPGVVEERGTRGAGIGRRAAFLHGRGEPSNREPLNREPLNREPGVLT
jgi:hypothetical protein